MEKGEFLLEIGYFNSFDYLKLASFLIRANGFNFVRLSSSQSRDLVLTNDFQLFTLAIWENKVFQIISQSSD